MTESIEIKDLGKVDFKSAFESMKNFIETDNQNENIWILQHHPVFTLGTAADTNHILDAGTIPIISTDRGGEVTYHGPGQIVIYFLLNVRERKLGPKKLVADLQKFIQDLLEEYDITSELQANSPGVYTKEKKIASIGLRISNGYSYHGISINVDMDLAPFSRINPCGYQGLEVTQMKDIHNKITLEDVKKTAINKLNNWYFAS